MLSAYYVMYIRRVDDDGKPQALPQFPNVGERVVHYLGRGTDDDQMKRDQENPLWAKVQDGVRPAWAPDFLRSGYCVVFLRKGLPKLAVKLGIKNPKKLKEQKGGLPHMTGGKRLLTFDDAWIVGVDVEKRPLVMPPLTLNDEDWWLATSTDPKLTSPLIVPGGGKVVIGAQRLADVVSEILGTPAGFPRPLPTEEDPDDYSEFVNPLVPVYLQKSPTESTQPRVNDQPSIAPSTDYASTQMFRW